MIRGLPILVFLIAIIVANEKPIDFILDTSEPYVYLKFDHVGPRTPLQEGEDPEGLWLRIVNNCRVPIEVISMGNAPGNKGAVIFDEVIPNRISGITTVVDWKSDPPELKHQAGRPPDGYSAELASRTVIQPGNELLFSVPRNHVSDDWFMLVKFALVVPTSPHVVEPWTGLTFSNYQIPVATSKH